MRNLWELPNNMQQQNTRAAQTMANPQTYWKTGRKNKVGHSADSLTKHSYSNSTEIKHVLLYQIYRTLILAPTSLISSIK